MLNAHLEILQQYQGNGNKKSQYHALNLNWTFVKSYNTHKDVKIDMQFNI